MSAPGQVQKDGVWFGCHIELAEDEQPDGCVIDYGAHSDCTQAKFEDGRLRKSQWTCPYWKPAKPPVSAS